MPRERLAPLFFGPLGITFEAIGENDKSRFRKTDDNAESLRFGISIRAFFDAPNSNGGCTVSESIEGTWSRFGDKQGVLKISSRKVERTPLLIELS